MTCIYKWIYYAYVVNPFPKVEISSMGFFEYNRYINNEEKEKDDVPTDYTDFGKSFFKSFSVCSTFFPLVKRHR